MDQSAFRIDQTHYILHSLLHQTGFLVRQLFVVFLDTSLSHPASIIGLWPLTLAWRAFRYPSQRPICALSNNIARNHWLVINTIMPLGHISFFIVDNELLR